MRRLLSIPLVPLVVAGSLALSDRAAAQTQLNWVTAADNHTYLRVHGAPAKGRGLLHVECASVGELEILTEALPLTFDLRGQVHVPLARADLAGFLWRISATRWGPGGAAGGGGTGGGATSGPLVLGPGTGGAPLAYQSGEVLVTEFQRNPAEVSDSRGEWLELQNLTGQTIDIEGWILADQGSDEVVLSAGGAGIPMLPNQCLVFGTELDRGLNGNVFVQYDYGAYHLSNGADEIALLRPDGTLVDSLAYDASGAWPGGAGRSASLSWDARDPFGNDHGGAWCSSDYIYDSAVGDRGSPTRANGDCP